MIVPPVVLGGTRSKGSVTLTTWEVPCNPLQMGCLQCLTAVWERELFLFKGSHTNSLYNWHSADITGCQSEILFVLYFNTLISSWGHPNKWIFVKMMFYPLCALGPICCSVLCACAVNCSAAALWHHQAPNRDCKVLAELVTWEPWPGLWCLGHFLDSEIPDSQVSTKIIV